METVGLIKKVARNEYNIVIMRWMLLWFQNETENVGRSWYKTID